MKSIRMLRTGLKTIAVALLATAVVGLAGAALVGMSLLVAWFIEGAGIGPPVSSGIGVLFTVFCLLLLPLAYALVKTQEPPR